MDRNRRCYDELDELEEVEEVQKFNPYHGYHGYFSTAEGATSVTARTKYGPGQKAIANIKAKATAENANSANRGIDKTLLYGLPEEQRKDFYFIRRNGNPDLYDHYYRQNTAAALEELRLDAKYKNILINTDLPRLEGTEKQIKYADRLRREIISGLISHIDGYAPKAQNVGMEAMDSFFESFQRAGFKVNNLSEAYNVLLKNQQAFDVKDVFTETSSKKIIEKYKYKSLQDFVNS